MDKIFTNDFVKIYKYYKNLGNNFKDKIKNNNTEYNNMIMKFFKTYENIEKQIIKEFNDLNKKLKEI